MNIAQLIKDWQIGRHIAASIRAGNFTYVPLMLEFGCQDEKEQQAYAHYFQKNPRSATVILDGLNKEKIGVRFSQFCTFLSENAPVALAMVPENTFADFILNDDLNAQSEFGKIFMAAKKAGIDYKILPAIKEVLKDELTKLHALSAWAVRNFPEHQARRVTHFPTHIVRSLMDIDQDFVKETVREAVADAIREERWHMPVHFISAAFESGITPEDYLELGQIEQIEKQLMSKPCLSREDVQTYSNLVTLLGDYNPYYMSLLSPEHLITAAGFLRADMKAAFNTNAEPVAKNIKTFSFNNFLDVVHTHPNGAVPQIIVETLKGLENNTPNFRN